ncbi:neutral zinc metallopeptidase [Rhizobium sp. SYY.PMSO]|uniref:neutral zinc metallopeptidase n=1 Tax=Rhizobium sp. SYY.PMSO TaxID=3382192 RepID=UPI00398FD0EE
MGKKHTAVVMALMARSPSSPVPHLAFCRAITIAFALEGAGVVISYGSKTTTRLRSPASWKRQDNDTFQKRRQGDVIPEGFNYGASAQRVCRFRRGFDAGAAKACDTFSGDM